MGTRTLAVAYPLLALAQTGSPTAAGWAGFALTIPILVFYVPGGLLVDRIPPRTIMLCAELGRWLSVASVLVVIPFEGPSLWHLLGAAAAEGTLWVLYTLAEAALLPSLVQPVMMQRALAKSEAASHLASIAGRPLGGYLFGLGPYIPFAMNTALFAVSWGLFFSLRRGSVRRSANRALLSDLSAGFQALRKQRFLGGAITVTTFTNLMVNALIMVFVAGSAGMSSLEIGLVLAAGGVGGALGSATAFFRRPQREVLLGHTWIWVLALFLAAVGAAVEARSLLFAAALFTTGLGGALSNVAIRSVEVNKVDPGTLARVVGVSRLSSHGSLCLAAPLGGLLVTWWGVTGGAWVLFAVMLLAAVLVTRVPWLRHTFTPPLPDLPDDAGLVRAPVALPGADQPPGVLGHVGGQLRRLGVDRLLGQLNRGVRLAGELLHPRRVQKQGAVVVDGLRERLHHLLLRFLHAVGLREREGVRDLGEGPAQGPGPVQITQGGAGLAHAGQDLTPAEQGVGVVPLPVEHVVEHAHCRVRVAAVPQGPGELRLNGEVGRHADHRGV
ncbi:MFS transporter [Nonomuraea sp. K274]|uniref:MFS transporter n=1 Tax=Nonomuraea cypriaca TaxID=1187855 RepID=A0A931A9Z1_9ACTN|nr:MFS transporter [Nonomuraea cypriaca]